jgi:predicted amino acid-binding ACT domain protein
MLLDKKKIVVTADNRSHNRIVLVGVNTSDRPGLLLDISQCLLQLDLEVHHTEAAVFDEQSVSVWRCSHIENKEYDANQISAMLNVSVATPPVVMYLRTIQVPRSLVFFFRRQFSRTTVALRSRRGKD